MGLKVHHLFNGLALHQHQYPNPMATAMATTNDEWILEPLQSICPKHVSRGRKFRRKEVTNRTYYGKDRQTDIKRYVVNLSTRILTDMEYKVLSKGLNFIPTPLDNRIVGLDDSFYDFCRQIRLKYFFSTRPQFSRPFHPFYSKSTWDPPLASPAIEDYFCKTRLELDKLRPLPCNRNITRLERRTIQQLSKNKDIVIKRADKGSAIVIENYSDYIKNGQKHLQDKTVYAELPDDPTETIVQEINHTLDCLKEKGLVDKEEHHFMTPKVPVRTQCMYFLKKLHKNPYAERPIVSGCNGATENISAYLDHILKPIMTSIPSYLKNTYELLEKLDILTFPQDCILCTVDVVSLYPSIPQTEGTEACLAALAKNNILPFPAGYLRPLFQYVLNCNIFTFAGKVYRQIKGTAMGTRMAPTYANIFMAKIEEEFLKERQLRPVLYLRYIDDILMIWTHSKNELDTFLKDLNNYHPHLKFTHSISEETVTFLDIDIYKGNNYSQTGHLDYKTHFKPTNTFQFLHYRSAHPQSVKRGLVTGEFSRIARTTKDPAVRKNKSQRIRKAFRQRGYPQKLTSLTCSTGSCTPTAVDPVARFKTVFNPYHRKILPALRKHWHLISGDQKSVQMLPLRPSICYKADKV